MEYVSANSMLPTDVSAQIKINLAPEYMFLRTGVQGKGSCYIHALLTDATGSQFRSLSPSERDKIAHEFRSNLAQTLTLDEYVNLGEIARVQTFQLLKRNWNALFQQMYSKKVKKEYGAESLFELLNTTITDLKDIDDKIESLDDDLRQTTKEIVSDALNRVFEKFKSNLEDWSKYIDQFNMALIDTKIGVNVLFIKPDGELYKLGTRVCSDMMENGRPFVLVYYLNERHFEAIYCRNADDKDQSLFSNKDPMILKLLKDC